MENRKRTIKELISELDDDALSILSQIAVLPHRNYDLSFLYYIISPEGSEHRFLHIIDILKEKGFAVVANSDLIISENIIEHKYLEYFSRIYLYKDLFVSLHKKLNRKSLSEIGTELFLLALEVSNNVKGYSIEYSTLLNNIGVIYADIGNFAEALSVIKKAVHTSENTDRADSWEVAAQYSNLGNLYKQFGEVDYAYQAYERNRDIIQKNPDKFGGESTAFSYKEIGYLLILKNRFEEAVENLAKSIVLFELIAKAGKVLPGLPNAYHDMSIALLNLSNFDLALTYSNKAIHLGEKVFGEHDHNIGVYLTNMAEILFQAERFDESLQIREKAIKIVSNKSDVNPVELGGLFLRHAASLVYGQYDFENAQLYLNKAKELLENQLPNDHTYFSDIFAIETSIESLLIDKTSNIILNEKPTDWETTMDDQLRKRYGIRKSNNGDNKK